LRDRAALCELPAGSSKLVYLGPPLRLLTSGQPEAERPAGVRQALCSSLVFRPTPVLGRRLPWPGEKFEVVEIAGKGSILLFALIRILLPAWP